MMWVLFVFISNGWGGGEVKQIASFPTEQSCQIAGKEMYDKIKRVSAPTCIQIPEKL